MALLRNDGSLLLFVNHGATGLEADEQPLSLSVPSGLLGLSASADFTNDGYPDLVFASAQGVYLQADQVSLQANTVSFTLTPDGQLTDFDPPQIGMQLTALASRDDTQFCQPGRRDQRQDLRHGLRRREPQRHARRRRCGAGRGACVPRP